MLRLGTQRALGVVIRRGGDLLRYSSNVGSVEHRPNAPLELDAAYQALLKDVDISIGNQNKGRPSGSKLPRELEVWPGDPDTLPNCLTSEQLDAQDDVSDHKESRKSPAAAFGSQRIGAVVLPLELQSTIERMIADLDGPTLHQDAKRLFMTQDAEWNTSYDVRYKSGKDAGRHALGDASAFATIALPAHYSVIYAVLDHVKQRLGPDWRVQHVIDWGAGTGSGLWASGHALQRTAGNDGQVIPEMEDIQLSHSTINTYLGIDKREGLVRIGKRLIKDVEMGELRVSWQKSFQEGNSVARATNVMALSAFLLSSLPSNIERRVLVKEMWESGAEVMILIDHKFENIAEARQQFLKLGKQDLEDAAAMKGVLKGAHVVAPCPHDSACPLHHPGRGSLECSFSQRLQRPPFVRKTKHSGTGHENTDYSYVVIRRGQRPTPPIIKAGRLGDVGKRELAKQSRDTPLTTLSLLPTDTQEGNEPQNIEETPENRLVSSPSHEPGHDSDVDLRSDNVAPSLRQEAYSWPRLVFPPLKRSGHIILDACAAEGQIMRMTIPKSQGKQPFYDARKASWGDLFPHEPKNPPQVRQPGRISAAGQDIGKRRHMRGDRKNGASYAQVSAGIQERRREMRKARRLANELS